jgi:hypothetical protein
VDDLDVAQRGGALDERIEPRADGQHAYVTIATEITGRAGVLGALERWFVTWLLRPVYVKELGLLAAVAATRAA